tara:strand:+ start:2663 stop:4681 length:2019 start_codon:yes stop_codon:yes gene_type:complete
MQKIFNLTSTFKSVEPNEDGSVNIKGYASTNDTDRAGDVINKEAWEKGGLENFGNNPIILFNHDYNRPIGRATSLETDEKGLKITANLSKSAGDVTNLVKEGILRAFSVGFRVKDADYMESGDGYLIKDAELFEVSVVSVPANQAATFSVAKSFDTQSEYDEWKKQFVKPIEATKQPQDNTDITSVFKEKIMSENKDFNLEEFAKNVAKETAATIAMQQADAKAKAIAEEKAVAEKEVEEKAIEDAKLEEKKAEVSAIIEAGTSGAEALVSDLEKRIDSQYSNVEEVVEGLKAELQEKSEEIQQIRESKRIFGERQKGGSLDSFTSDLEDIWLLGKATGKGLNTKHAIATMEKVNAMSGIDVSSADFEQTVSTNIERDIQNELVLAPLFREIAMNSATQILPILPDAGYAEFTGNQAASGSAPHGNLDPRGDAYDPANGAGIVMTERTLSTKKLISQSYLGNETEEDAIMPILPLIRESMIRSHARGIENALLAGDDADGVYGTSGAAFEGILHLARNDSDLTQTSTAFASDALTALQLLAARKNMGKYGLKAEDVIYVVSQRGYFELLEDAEFQDVNLVGDMATKISGEIGTVFGSKVIVCDEFATPAVSKFHAVAVYPRNYVMPRLRGMTVESDYEVAAQRRVLVASQRIGFTDLIDGATSKWALQYKAS